jgi:hypothetical protein
MQQMSKYECARKLANSFNMSMCIPVNMFAVLSKQVHTIVFRLYDHEGFAFKQLRNNSGSRIKAH